LLALALLALAAGGLWISHTQEQHMRQSAEDELQAIARLKVKQIADWRADQLKEAGELTTSAFLIDGAARWLAAPRADAAADILSRFRGVKVVAAPKAIPDSPRLMVAKVDAAKTFTVWRTRSLLILTLLASGVTLLVAAASVVWQRNQKTLYRALFRPEAARRADVERHRITLQSIGDAVIVTDVNGRVELVKPVADARLEHLKTVLNRA
jgi:PAS domain-containing protein